MARRLYDNLCAQVKRQGGRVRLAPVEDGSAAITVTVADEGDLTRAIGFVGPLDELDAVAGLALWWLTSVGVPDGGAPNTRRNEEEER